MLKNVYNYSIYLSLTIGVYSIIFLKILKKGFLNRITYYDNYANKKINKRIYFVVLFLGIFFVIVDVFLYKFRWNNYMILVSTALKIISYKVFEYYYNIKSEKFKRKYLKYFVKKKVNIISLISLLSIYGGSVVLFFYNKLYIPIIILSLIFGLGLYFYIKHRKYKYFIYFFRGIETIVFLYIFILLFSYETVLKYLAIIGLLLII